MESQRPQEIYKNALDLLHELALVHNLYVQFDELGEEGPQNRPTFHMEARAGKFVAYGSGPSKKQAKLNAASNVVKELKKLPVPEDANPYWCKPHLDLKDPLERPYFFYNKNPVSALVEILMVRKQKTAEFKVVAVQTLPSNRIRYTMEVRVGKMSCQAMAPSKKKAKLLAAEKMLEMMGFAEQMESQNPPMQPHEAAMFQKHVYEQQAQQKREHQEALRALTRPVQEPVQNQEPGSGQESEPNQGPRTVQIPAPQDAMRPINPHTPEVETASTVPILEQVTSCQDVTSPAEGPSAPEIIETGPPTAENHVSISPAETPIPPENTTVAHIIEKFSLPPEVTSIVNGWFQAVEETEDTNSPPVRLAEEPVSAPLEPLSSAMNSIPPEENTAEVPTPEDISVTQDVIDSLFQGVENTEEDVISSPIEPVPPEEIPQPVVITLKQASPPQDDSAESVSSAEDCIPSPEEIMIPLASTPEPSITPQGTSHEVVNQIEASIAPEEVQLEEIEPATTNHSVILQEITISTTESPSEPAEDCIPSPEEIMVPLASTPEPSLTPQSTAHEVVNQIEGSIAPEEVQLEEIKPATTNHSVTLQEVTISTTETPSEPEEASEPVLPISPQPVIPDITNGQPQACSTEKSVESTGKTHCPEATHCMITAMFKKLLPKLKPFPDHDQQVALVQRLRKVENQVVIPENIELRAKDLKIIGKAAAKSLLQEMGSASSLFLDSNTDFIESTVKQHLTIQLITFLANSKTGQACFFSGVSKIFRSSLIPKGPLSTYLLSRPRH